MDKLNQFEKQKYLNLETFRKNGESMKTPVWFTQAGQTIYVLTMANSGKVKRIRNNGRVNIAACRMDGKLTGTWVTALARQITDRAVITTVDRLMDNKYGLLKKMFLKRSSNTGSQDAILEIIIAE
jgi:PPOX class probable F420-dependent enzyme